MVKTYMLGPSYCMHDLFIFSKLKHTTDVATAFLTAYAPHVFFFILQKDLKYEAGLLYACQSHMLARYFKCTVLHA